MAGKGRSFGISYLLLLGSVFIWALNYIVRQILLKEFSPFFLSALSLTVVSCIFVAAAFMTKSIVSVTRKEMALLLLSATVGLIANQIFLYKGLQMTSATNASLIFTMSPLMTAGLAALFLKETVTWRMIAGCLIALAGLYQALNMTGIKLQIGDWMILGATFTFSCNLIFVRMLSQRLSPFLITAYSFAVSFLLYDPFVFLFTEMQWHHSFSIWVLAIVSILVAQGLTNVMWNKGMETVGAARAAIVLNLQPMMTILLEFILLGHIVTGKQIFGVSLVFAGVLLGTMPGSFYKQKNMNQPELPSNRNIEA
ncbi:DMT family transporter [Paenibacillus filicis]|uniref:DMT family transporter n=1 Tax=Paenibacillus gyeongsangnamensis TaxID=3388067 RepID=A0ABT4QE94_9BACL|nr:DMT family transporter [Paenibacillus filicis]MCZ8515122.1 DMT family transporter [Paenibacillus filicis]